MKNIARFLIIGGVLVLVLGTQPLWGEEDFPLSVKSWQATVIRLEGVNTSQALAVGQVRKRNAEEYCDREAEWSQDKGHRKFSKERCVQKILRQERGKFYAIRADCPEKILRSHIGSFTLTGEVSKSGQNLWRNNATGEVLSGSKAGICPLLDAQFELLCPAVVKP
jgi:hypothetical protein